MENWDLKGPVQALTPPFMNMYDLEQPDCSGLNFSSSSFVILGKSLNCSDPQCYSVFLKRTIDFMLNAERMK